MLPDSTRSIVRSAKHFFSGTMLSRVTGMVRDMAMAYTFGTQASIAAFMVAVRFAHLLRRLFGEGALQSAFIPEFEHFRHEKPEKAFRFFRDLKVVLTLFLSLLITIICIGLGFILAYGNLSPGNQEIVLLTIWMLPSLLFLCLYGFNICLLQCEKSYFVASVAPVAFNLIWILSVWFLRDQNPTEAMPKLAIGVVLACVAQWMMTLPSTYKILKVSLQEGLFSHLFCCSKELIKFSIPLFLAMTGVAASQVNNAIDAIFARWAEPEGPALLWYAIRIQQLPLGLFGIAIAGAILPPLSRAIKEKAFDRYKMFLRFALKNTFLVMIPATCLLLLLGDSAINLLYGHGDFGASSVVSTTRCLWAYALGLIPAAAVLLLAPACYAQQDYRWPVYASFLAMFLNFVLNAFLILGLGLGAMSVALATSVSAWVNLFFLGYILSKRDGKLFDTELSLQTSKIILGSLLGCISTLLWRFANNDFPYSAIFANAPATFPRDVLSQCLTCALGGLAFLLPFGLVSWIFLNNTKNISEKCD